MASKGSCPILFLFPVFSDLVLAKRENHMKVRAAKMWSRWENERAALADLEFENRTSSAGEYKPQCLVCSLKPLRPPISDWSEVIGGMER